MFTADPCPGQAEIVQNNSLPHGYSSSTQGLVNPGQNVDMLFNGTGSLSVSARIL